MTSLDFPTPNSWIREAWCGVSAEFAREAQVICIGRDLASRYLTVSVPVFFMMHSAPGAFRKRA